MIYRYREKYRIGQHRDKELLSGWSVQRTMRLRQRLDRAACARVFTAIKLLTLQKPHPLVYLPDTEGTNHLPVIRPL